MSPSVLLAGGGSAGHVSPLLALADALRRRDGDTRVLALGTREGLESRLVPQRGYELAVVPKVPLPRRPTPALFAVPGKLLAAVRAAGEAIDRIDADVVVGMGGYVSTPAYLAARRRGVPIVVHEQNARPGIANRIGARLTPYVATATSGTGLRGARLTGMPLRREITSLDRPARRAEACRYFDLDPARPTLFVFGGSLGAVRLNEVLAATAEQILATGAQILHATGAGKRVDLELPGYHQAEYIDRMDLAYAAADLAVGRSGASTVAELAAVGLPAVFVPLPIGNGEQRLNARDVVAAGGALLVDNAAFTPDWVRGTLVPLVADPARVAAMARAAAGAGIRDGDERLAELVHRAIRSPHPSPRSAS